MELGESLCCFPSVVGLKSKILSFKFFLSLAKDKLENFGYPLPFLDEDRHNSAHTYNRSVTEKSYLLERTLLLLVITCYCHFTILDAHWYNDAFPPYYIYVLWVS